MARKLIYFDNCTDSFPKAPNIYKKSGKFMENSGIYPYYGNSSLHKEADELIKKTKIKLSNIFNISNPSNICFSSSNTEAVNFLLKNSLKKGDHIITTNFENDYFLKILRTIEKQGIQVSYIKADKLGNVDPLHFLWAVRETTKLIYCSHSSPFNDVLLPIKELGAIAKKHNIPFAVDVSQTAGLIDIDSEECQISYLISNLNLHLLSPQGLAFLFINKELLATNPKSYKEVISFSDINNLNLYSVSALFYALEFYEERERKKDLEKMNEFKSFFINSFLDTDELKFYLPNKESLPTLTFSVVKHNPLEFKDFLLEKSNIIINDCSYFSSNALEAFGIKNAFKITFNFFNTLDDLKITVKTIKQFFKNGNEAK